MKSYMRYRTITISFYDCNGEIIFASDEIRAKMPHPETAVAVEENCDYDDY